MLRIPCPKCHKTIYSSDVETFHPCPYCGFIFSGKYGAERRRDRRTKKGISFLLSFKGQNFKGRTVDLSGTGIGIKILGKPPVAEGDVLALSIADTSMNAKVMWVKKLPDKSLAGLQRIAKI